MGNATPPLPYWQTNIPAHLRPLTCPPFLQNLSQKDISILLTPSPSPCNPHPHPHPHLSWPSVQQIIRQNNLDRFQRKPLDLRRYLEHCHAVRAQHGSMMRYILDVKLGWREEEMKLLRASSPSSSPSSSYFKRAIANANADAHDAYNNDSSAIRVLLNDWPYAIDEKIVHLVVWTKFALEDDPETGETREDVKRDIETWVEMRFGERCGRDNVIWFRNWKSLKSIHAVEHFHVMLYDPDPEFVKEVTRAKGERERDLSIQGSRLD